MAVSSRAREGGGDVRVRGLEVCCGVSPAVEAVEERRVHRNRRVLGLERELGGGIERAGDFCVLSRDRNPVCGETLCDEHAGQHGEMAQGGKAHVHLLR